LITEVTIRIDIFYKTNYAKLFAWRFGLLLIAQARCLRQRGETIKCTTTVKCFIIIQPQYVCKEAVVVL